MLTGYSGFDCCSKGHFSSISYFEGFFLRQKHLKLHSVSERTSSNLIKDLLGGSDEPFNFRFLFEDIFGRMDSTLFNIRMTYQDSRKTRLAWKYRSDVYPELRKKFKVQTFWF